MMQNPKAIKEILDKFNSLKIIQHGKLANIEQNSNKQNFKIWQAWEKNLQFIL